MIEAQDRQHLDDDRRFGVRLAQLRTERGLSLKELAHRARMHPSRLSKLERGELINPDAALMARLASALELSLEVFLAQTRGVVSAPMRPAMSPRTVLTLVSQVRWTPERTAAFQTMARAWIEEDRQKQPGGRRPRPRSIER